MTGSGNKKSRSIVQVGVAIINVILNIWLIPQFSWESAAYATLISNILFLIPYN
ncbi:MAG: polysaccharide biosynthesis C-terminal domain-containing protein [Waterburya sp.]